MNLPDDVLAEVRSMRSRLLAGGIAKVPRDLVPADLEKRGRVTNADIVQMALRALDRLIAAPRKGGRR